MKKFVKTISIILSALMIFQFIFTDIGYAQTFTQKSSTKTVNKPVSKTKTAAVRKNTGKLASKPVAMEITASEQLDVQPASSSDSLPPAVPQNLSYKALSKNSIELAWSPSADDSGFAAYEVYRNNSLLATVSGSAVYVDSGLLPDTEYQYQVAAFDASGNYSSKSTVLTAIINEQTSNESTAVNIASESTTAASINLRMFNANTSAASNTIYLRYKLYNTGASPIKLSDIKIKYYYTINGEKSQNFWCDWSNIGGSNVTGTFVKMPEKKKGADTYAEIGFTSGAGMLNAGESAELHCRLAKADWTNYDQSDDYSLNSTGTDYIDWDKVTVYDAGSLVWGREPGTETPADITPPSTPSNLVSYSISSSEIGLTWSAATDDTGVSGYIIYRNGTEIARVGEGTAYTDTGLSSDTTYTYEVAAYDYSNNVSAKSSPVSTKTGENINSSIKLQLYNANKADPNNTIFPWYKIYNSGNVPVNLESVKLRYYYTINGEEQQNFWCDWSSIGSSNVIGTFIKMPAVVEGVDYCLEISFKSGTGVLKPGESAELQCRIAKNNWTNYKQSDDYSFNTAGGYTDWNKVSGYINGNLVWGTEPITAPANINAVTQTKTVTLSWNAVPCATSYEVEADGVITDIGDILTYTHSGLIPGTKHVYRVRAKNNIMVSPWSTYVTVITLLDKPVNVKKEVAETQINLSWDAVDGANSYDIEIDGSMINNGTKTQYTMDNLKAGTLHTARIRAKGGAIDGEWTDLLQIWTLPDIPANIRTTSASTSITLSWDSVTGASGYEVEVSGNTADNGTDTSYIHSGLEPNTQRTYRVRAKNPSGVSAWSEVIAAATLPGTAFNIQVQPTYNSLKILWDVQAGASAYDIEIDSTEIIEVKENSYLHEGLITNSEHKYRVRSKNKDGVSEWSSVAAGVVLPSIPGNFSITTVSSSAIALSWEEVTGATGYDVEADGKVLDNALNNTYSHTGLKPNEEHTYRVRAKNGTVTGEWSQEIRKATLLPAPENLKAEASGSQIKLEWDMVAGSGYYEVEIDGKVIKAEAAAEYIHSGISAGTVYTYRVRAVNSNGSGDWSSAVTAAGSLGIPSNLATVVQSSSIIISWSAVSGASAYDVMIDGKIISSIKETTYEYTGLVPNSRHIFRIRAVNPDCTGEWSKPGEWSDPQAAVTRVGIPSNVKTIAESTEITVTWDSVDGADSYDISVDGTTINNGSSTVYKHSGLKSNSKHTYSVRAKNANGEGQWSGTVTQVTGPAVPQNIQAETGINQIKLTWDKPDGAVSYEIEVNGEIKKDILTETFTSEGLEPNTRHEYRIRAKNSESVCGEWSGLLEASTTEELIINVQRDSGFNFVIAVPKKDGADSYDIIVNYNADEVEVLDLYAATQKLDLETGNIEGTKNITVKQFSKGRIVFEVSGADKAVMTIVRFMSKTNNQTKMSYVVE